MPRTIKSRTASTLDQNIWYTTGHTDPYFSVVSSIVTTAINYTTKEIKNKINPTEYPDPASTVTIEEASILDDLGLTSTLEVVVNTKTSTYDGNNFIDIPENDFNEELISTEKVITGTLTVTVPGESTTIDIPTTTSIIDIETQITEIDNLVTDTSLVPIDLLETLYTDFIKAYKDSGPYYIGNIHQMTEIYQAVQEVIDKQGDNVDVSLYIYRDILNVLVNARDVYTDRIRTDREICVIRQKYDEMKIRLDEVLNELAICNGDAVSKFCGSLAIKIKKPKPLIYAQAILNIHMAWYIFLHGTPITPREYAATVAYVESLGGKQAAYDKLIQLLDERYKDDNEEFEEAAAAAATTCSDKQPTTSSGDCTTTTDDSCSSDNVISEECSCPEVCTEETYTDYSSCDDENVCKPIYEPTYRPIEGGNITAFVVPGYLSVDIVDKSVLCITAETARTSGNRRHMKNKMEKKHKPDCRKYDECIEYEYNSLPVYRPIDGGPVSAFVVPGCLKVKLDKNTKRVYNRRSTTYKRKKKKKKSRRRRKKARNCCFGDYVNICNKTRKCDGVSINTCNKTRKNACNYITIKKLGPCQIGSNWAFCVPGTLDMTIEEKFREKC